MCYRADLRGALAQTGRAKLLTGALGGVDSQGTGAKMAETKCDTMTARLVLGLLLYRNGLTFALWVIIFYQERLFLRSKVV
jgi:hypothetical protein